MSRGLGVSALSSEAHQTGDSECHQVASGAKGNTWSLLRMGSGHLGVLVFGPMNGRRDGKCLQECKGPH